jgi:hypothetical protein
MTNPLREALFADDVKQASAFLMLPDGTAKTHGGFLEQARLGVRPGGGALRRNSGNEDPHADRPPAIHGR